MTSIDMVRHDMSTRDEVLTLSETASYLKIAERTIHRMIQRREIPCARVGSQWRFLRSVLDDWLLSRMAVVPRNELSTLLDAAEDIVPLAPLLQDSSIVDGLAPGSPIEILTQLAAPLDEQGIVSDLKRYVRLLLERERLSSTALGYGAAVPHVRRPAENPAGAPAVIFGICREGVDYDAPDKWPVRFFFLLNAESELVHLRLLKRISFLFRDPSVGESLLACDRSELIGEVARQESRIFTG